MSLERLQLLEDEMKKCFRCSCCKMVPLPTVRSPRYSDGCPVSRVFHFHGFSGSGKQLMALSLCHGRIAVDEALARIASACAACGLCDVSCKFIMEAERHRVNMALREHIVDQGFALPAHRRMMENLEMHGSPVDGPPRWSLTDWARQAGIKVLPGEEAEVLVYTGGTECNDPGSLETARKLALLLRRAGLDVGVLGDAEPGSGLPAYWTGHREIFRRAARKNLDLIDGLGVRTLLAVSGSCLGAFRSKYPEAARPFRAETLHATEILDRLIAQGALRLPGTVARKVAYHDPCYLGRQSEPPVAWAGETRVTRNSMTYHVPPRPVNRGAGGVYDPPRRILRAIRGIEFVELYRIREYSFCCGGGGGLPQAFPEAARAAGRHRVEEARDVGAETLVTACHHCRASLTYSQEGSGGEPMPVADIIDLVFEAAGMKE